VVTAEGGRVELGEQVIVMEQAVGQGRQGHSTRSRGFDGPPAGKAGPVQASNQQGATMGSAAQYFEVEAPVEQVYAYWRDFSNFPSFMPDVEEVTVTGPTTSHWRVSGPLGKSVEWDAEITEDVPNQRIAWKSIGDSQVDNAGAVRFDDRGGRTNIEVSLEYNPPGGKAGELVAELVKDPDKQVQRAVENFRLVVERGGLGAV